MVSPGWPRVQLQHTVAVPVPVLLPLALQAASVGSPASGCCAWHSSDRTRGQAETSRQRASGPSEVSPELMWVLCQLLVFGAAPTRGGQVRAWCCHLPLQPRGAWGIALGGSGDGVGLTQGFVFVKVSPLFKGNCSLGLAVCCTWLLFLKCMLA